MTIPTLVFPQSRIARMVAREEAEIFTILFPIRMAESIFTESSCIFVSILARLCPSSDKERIRILLTVVRDVSADEKKADNNSSKSKAIACIIVVESTVFISSIYRIYMLNITKRGIFVNHSNNL